MIEVILGPIWYWQGVSLQDRSSWSLDSQVCLGLLFIRACSLTQYSVVTIGPEFSIDASIDMDIEAEAKMVVKAGWDFPSLKLVFPASKGGSTGSATVSGTDNRKINIKSFAQKI